MNEWKYSFSEKANIMKPMSYMNYMWSLDYPYSNSGDYSFHCICVIWNNHTSVRNHKSQTAFNNYALHKKYTTYFGHGAP